MDYILCSSLEIDIFVWTTLYFKRSRGEDFLEPDRMRQKQ